METSEQRALRGTLYDPRFEHDACGIGFVADISGQASHDVLRTAIRAVVNMRHRGAIDADARTGDGAGVLTQIPRKLFNREVARLGFPIPRNGELAVGMFFLPRENLESQIRAKRIAEEVLVAHGASVYGWRSVPVDPSALGPRAFETRPEVQQLLLRRPAHLSTAYRYEQELYLVRRQIEKRLQADGIDGVYISSLSSRTIVYKGLFVSPQLDKFYHDLADPDYKVAIAVFHQRYSTNTFPTWERAQPFRLLCHNGEINTLQGNVNWFRARERALKSRLWGEHVDDLRPVIDPTGSDSAMLDNVLELLARGGRDVRHAMMMLIPEAWEHIADVDPDRAAFYRYHSALMEPWDGPAAVAFTDGRVVGTTLDRNGLRPVRYAVTADDWVVVASEAGAVELDETRVIRKGKLGPGQMIAVDTSRGQLMLDGEIKSFVANRRPYALWADRQFRRLPPAGPQHDAADSAVPATFEGSQALLRFQAAFGYTAEELTVVMRPMVESGQEPVGSMGDDTPHAVLSERPRPLFNYFKQRFAEVTNPPIDPLREELVMSTRVLLGPRGNLLDETESHARLLELRGPILQDHELDAVKDLREHNLRTATWSATFDVTEGVRGLERALEDLCFQCSGAVDMGATILILSDRGIGPNRAPIPALLAVAAVHHHLIREGKRMRCSLIAETGEAREVHHFATLVGYGASAVNPYLALASVQHEVSAGQLRHKGIAPGVAAQNYIHAVEKGLLKVMSKMGISTLDSYSGAQIFEALGLDQALVDRCFTHTPSRLGGVGLEKVAREVLRWHDRAFPRPAHAGLPDPAAASATMEALPLPPAELDSPGFYKFKKGGEYHAYSPQAVRALQQAVRLPGADNGSFEAGYRQYQVYAEMAAHPAVPAEPRDLLDFKPGRPIPLDEVEPVEAIVRRFSTAAMSHGALSKEAHETLAAGMTRLGAASNAGEGGEDEARFGTEKNSQIKQVASGRFGVTPAYLINSEELQIKMAQGSKPGEGGQLPGHKVTAEIARIRHTLPGVALISPPPHHDIYSIEDLAQLIYDLNQVNPEARVSVKLVAQAGVGTIAAGVIKGGADIVLISGHSGGTGASPLSSIKNAGIPWEMGLAETQQTLVANGLRGRATLRTDGGLRTGRDVVIGAMLGADEFSFGTAVLVATGCMMARTCHTNTCPVGIASQDPALRAKYPGKPEHVVLFMRYVAQEVREILAGLGFRRLDEVIGRSDLLRQVITGYPPADQLDLGRLLTQPGLDGPRHNVEARAGRRVTGTLNDRLMADARQALEGRAPVTLAYAIRNTDRTVGATLAGAVTRRVAGTSVAPPRIHARFDGSAGQSFGAFCADGMRLVLVGEANDYVGKGMAGGEIVIRPAEGAAFAWQHNVIAGNTVLYGATGGQLYAAGRAGERFAVRNSGAQAVVEGIGDHGCEYMTGGLVVVLGEVGHNFGAGMTGGTAFVLDETGSFRYRYNPQLVGMDRLIGEREIEIVRRTIERHLELTGSPRARAILDHWNHYLPLFWRVAPRESAAAVEATNEGAELAQENGQPARDAGEGRYREQDAQDEQDVGSRQGALLTHGDEMG